MPKYTIAIERTTVDHGTFVIYAPDEEEALAAARAAAGGGNGAASIEWETEIDDDTDDRYSLDTIDIAADDSDDEEIDPVILPVVVLAKAQIVADVLAYKVPRDVGTFGALHNYVDANEYGTEDETAPMPDIETLDRVQSVLDKWIKRGGLRLVAPEEVEINPNKEQDHGD